ncbi:MAG TPA: amidohydrolase family protein [Gemmatimonadales bacterium]|nr:amidohydrolase family protein [Gemmatimonadales bacterium]
MTALRLAADWVVTMDGAPLRGGAVVVDAAGRIAAVEPGTAPEAPPGPPARQTVLLPGLVNAHTHLELTGLGGTVTEDDFVAWIGHLIRLLGERDRAEYLAAARQGIRDNWAIGVTTVADCGATGTVIEALAELGASGIAYHEVFGPDPAAADAQLAAWQARLAELRRFEGPRVRLGASPHAPYSVSAPLYRRAAAHARAEGLPLAVHIAETPLEDDLLLRGAGGFAERLRARGLALAPAGVGPLALLEREEVLGPDLLAIHCCTASGEDLDRLARHGAAVAHCPRSNRRHHGLAAPIGAMLASGLRVGVGTDSEASVHPLDLRAEARAARELAGLDAQEALALITLGAARAIGLGDEVGALVTGRWADLVAVAIPASETPEQVYEAVLTVGEVEATWVGGREVHRRSA